MAVQNQSEAADLPRPWLALLAVLTGVALIVLEGSIVNVLVPTIVDDLGIDRTQVLWVTSIYSLVFASLLITFGVLSDRIGRRRMFLIGLIVFVVGNVLAGLSQSGLWLIGARGVEAVGGAMMLPTSIAIINVHFRGRQRAAAFGMWGAIFGGMAAFGPLIGGWLAQDLSWRWAFYINLPLGILSMLLVLRFVPDSRTSSAERVDPVSVLLSTAGLGLLVFGLIEGQQYGWFRAISSWRLGPLQVSPGDLSVALIGLVAGVLLLVVFAWREVARGRRGQHVMVDMQLFRIRRYAYGNVVAAVVSLGEFAALFMLPLWLQSVAGYGPLETGAVVAALGVGTILAGGLARRVSQLLGPTRLVRVGMVLEITGLVALAFTLSTSWSAWWLAPPLFIYGIGVGFDSAQLTNVVLADVPPMKSGTASSMTSTFRQVGSTLGGAMLGTLLFSLLSHNLASDLAAVPDFSERQRQQIVDGVVNSSGQAIVPLERKPGLAPIVTDAKESFTSAARTMTLVAAGFIGAGLLASFGLPKDAPTARRREAEGGAS